jgi:ArsR family transcriptional regulator
MNSAVNSVVVDPEPRVSANGGAYERNPNLHLRLDGIESEQFALAFKALSNPIRLQILDLIHQGGGQLCGCDIERHFDVAQPTISHHLKVLRDAGLISSEPRGVWVAHRINVAAFTALQGVLLLLTKAEPQE